MVCVLKLEEQNLNQRINPMETALTVVIDEVDDLTSALAQLVAQDREGAIDPEQLAEHNAALNRLRRYLGSVAYRLSVPLIDRRGRTYSAGPRNRGTSTGCERRSLRCASSTYS